jgi:hypothetical protein
VLEGSSTWSLVLEESPANVLAVPILDKGPRTDNWSPAKGLPPSVRGGLANMCRRFQSWTRVSANMANYSYYDVHLLLALCPCDFSSYFPNLLLIIYDRWPYLIRRRVGSGLGTYMTERPSLLVMHTARMLAFFLAVIYLF